MVFEAAVVSGRQLILSEVREGDSNRVPAERSEEKAPCAVRDSKDRRGTGACPRPAKRRKGTRRVFSEDTKSEMKTESPSLRSEEDGDRAVQGVPAVERDHVPCF